MVFEVISNLPYGNYLLALLIIAISVVVAKIIMFIIEKILIRLTAKTKTTLDDAIIKAIQKPLYIATILVGIYLSIDYLNFLDAYLGTIGVLFSVIWILLGAYTAAKVVREIFTWYAMEVSLKTGSNFDKTVASMIRRIISAFIYAIALIMILHRFGVEVTPLLTGLGIAGLAVALAFQDTLSNLFAGTFIVSDKMVRVGDFIELDNGMKGTVREIKWRTTRIRTLQNNELVIPNNKLANSIVTNYNSVGDETSVVVHLSVDQNADLDKVERISIETAREVASRLGKSVSDPFVTFYSLSAAVKFSVTFKSKDFSDYSKITHEFIKTIKKRFNEEEIKTV